MTIGDVLPLLDNPKQRGTRWSARCPAHADKSPSLSVTEGDKGILLRCWAGCSLPEICSALRIKPKDLFFDALDTDWRKRKAIAAARVQRRHAEAAAFRKEGRRLDALRLADDFVRSRRGVDISLWTADRLHDELNRLAHAYTDDARRIRDFCSPAQGAPPRHPKGLPV
jgi:hypothetical protein